MQIINLSNIFISLPRHVFYFTRKTDSNSHRKFIFLLSYENWEDVFLEKTVNIISNFLNTYLRKFYASFPTIKTQNFYKPNPWLTTGITISCSNKRKIYLTCRNSNDPTHKKYYKKYCQILSTVIISAKNSIIINLYWNLIINQKLLRTLLKLSLIIQIPLIIYHQ